jgi:hypothetical protein
MGITPEFMAIMLSFVTEAGNNYGCNIDRYLTEILIPDVT